MTDDNSGEAFTAPMSESVNKYADIFTKPGKLVARDIQDKTELVDPEKPILYNKLQRMIERQFVAALEVLECYQFFITSVNSP